MAGVLGRPLAGIRVLSMEQAAALPFATRHLADLGADVIRVESHRRGAGGLDEPELSRNKRRLALDLSAPGGPELFRRVAAECDVVAHNFTPRVVRRFGIDDESLRPGHPGLVYVSLTGFGTTGPWAERPLFGPGAEAVSGHNLLIGDPDQWPGRPGTITYADNTCGLYTALAVLGALEERRRTRVGRFIDISLYECAVSLLGPVLAERSLGAPVARNGNGDSRYAVHGVFASVEPERLVAVAARADQVAALRMGLGLGAAPHAAGGGAAPREDGAGGADGADGSASAAGADEAGVVAEVSRAIGALRAEDVVAAIQGVGVAAAVVADAGNLLTDEHLWERGWFADLPDGLRTVVCTGPAWGGGAGLQARPSGPVGADSRAVLTEVAGLTDAEVDQVVEAGVVGVTQVPSATARAAGTTGPSVEVRIERGELARVDVDFEARIDDARRRARGAPPVHRPGVAPPGATGRSARTEPPRVLDLSFGAVGAAYTGRLLADLGWEVVKVESPEGDPLRGRSSRWGGGRAGASAAVDGGKASVVPTGPEELSRLAGAADVVIGDLSPSVPTAATAGLGPGEVAGLAPRCATVSVSPFGMHGPRSAWVGSELVVQAVSGILYLTGEWDQLPQQLPPYQGALIGGLAGALAAVAAVLGESASEDPAPRPEASGGPGAAGPGGRPVVDVAMAEALAAYGYGAVAAYARRGEVTRREARVKAGLRMAPAADGYVYCAPGALASMRMDGVAELVGEPRLAEDRFQTAEGRIANWEELKELLLSSFSTRTVREWFEAAGEMHLTFAPVQSVEDLVHCPQLEARGLLQEVAIDGQTVRLPGRPWHTHEETPRLRPPSSVGADTDEVRRRWLGRERISE